MRVLITGGRAPVALDLGRILKRENAEVFVADSLEVYLSQGSKVFAKSFIIPKPADNVNDFINSLNRIIKKYKINYIVPTCEEVFFISKYKDKLECKVFTCEFEKLELLHNKFKFPNFIKERSSYASAPKTYLVNDVKQLNNFKSDCKKLVFKPVYSRFATQTLVKPAWKKLRKIEMSVYNPWVAQEFIKGKEYCTYSIAVNGKLNAHVTYEPIYRLGLGASMYFTSIQHKQIEKFVRELVAQMNYTGHIGFDIIEDKEGVLYILECNPRGTSGLHFLKDKKLAKCFLEEKSEIVTPDINKSLMAFIGMLIIGIFKYSFISPFKFFKNLTKASDVVYSKEDRMPFFYQFYVLIFIVWSAIKNKSSLHAASSVDTEWNGQEI